MFEDSSETADTMKFFNRKDRIGKLAGISLAVVLGVTGCAVLQPNDKDTLMSQSDYSKADVNLAAGTWNYMPGVTDSSASGIAFRQTGEAIRQFADDTQPNGPSDTFTPNSPMNYYGTHLGLKDDSDFKLEATLSDINQSATLSLQSLPPSRLDESIMYQPGMSVTVRPDNIDIMYRTDFAGEERTVTLPRSDTDNEADITITQSGSDLKVESDGQGATIPELFTNEVWFGLDTEQSFVVTKLAATALNGTKIANVDTSKLKFGTRDKNGLAATAEKTKPGVEIGTAADLPVLMSDPAYAAFVVAQFNQLEPEHLGKMQALQPIEGQYEFGELDAMVDFAARHNMNIHGHTLIFNEANPKWLTDKLQTATPDEARQLLTSHITTVVQRYDGKHGHGTIKYWDLVNEVLDPEEFGQVNANNIWYKAIGPDYIADAFAAARAANPDAKYGFNEYAGENDDDRFEAMVQLAKTYKPDYIGFQSHFDEDTLDDDDAVNATTVSALSEKFAELADLGVEVRVSEASVAENGDTKQQANVYGTLLKSIMKAPNGLGFNVWGATNNEGRNFYFTASSDDSGDDAPTSQVDDGPITLKPAWSALQKAAKK